MRDIIIGEDFPRAFGATKIFGLPDKMSISENKSWYMIHDNHNLLISGISIYLRKDTHEGGYIPVVIDALKKCKDQSEVDKMVDNYIRFVDNIILKNCTVEHLRDVLVQMKKEAFDDGVEHAQAEMRKALGFGKYV